MFKRYYIPFTLLFALVFAGVTDLFGQKYPERRLIRQGNKDYKKGEYIDSEVDYRRALEKTPDSYEAQFNLGNALYKQERYEEASAIFSRLAADSTRLDNASSAHFNNGNALFKQDKLQEALEEYKQALRRNPNDTEAKFNLAYVKKLLDRNDDQDDDDKNEDGDGGGDGEDNKDNNDNRDDDSGDGQGDGQKDPQDGDGENDPDKGNDQKPPQPQQGEGQSGMSKAEAERMLEAIQMGEDKTKEKMDEKKAAAVQRSEKNW